MTVGVRQRVLETLAPKPTLKARIKVKLEATIEARQQVTTQIKALTEELGSINQELLTMVEANDGVIQTDRWKAQTVQANRSSFNKDLLATKLHEAGVKATLIATCYEQATTVKAGNPYVRVDTVEKKTAEAAAKAG
jgi:hypothetical protein